MFPEIHLWCDTFAGVYSQHSSQSLSPHACFSRGRIPDLNDRPPAWQADALTTRPQRPGYLGNLDIDDNEIDHPPDGVFSSVTKLSILEFSGNRLTEATGEIFRGLDLWKLNIGGNQITSIRGLQRASYVYFTNNQLTTLEEDVFLPDDEDAPKINLHLPRNPFHCDKRMCWLKQTEKNKRVSFYYWGYATSSPSCENFPGVDWREVDLGCDEE